MSRASDDEITMRRNIEFDSLESKLLLDAQPSGLPPAYQPPQMTMAEYQQYCLAMNNYEAMQGNPNIEPGYPDVGSAIAQGYANYGASLLGAPPDPGPSCTPPGSPTPMGQHVLDAALSQMVVGQHNYDPGGSFVPADPGTAPEGPAPGDPPFLYDPVPYS